MARPSESTIHRNARCSADFTGMQGSILWMKNGDVLEGNLRERMELLGSMLATPSAPGLTMANHLTLRSTVIIVS
jgi:hypothetical protein